MTRARAVIGLLTLAVVAACGGGDGGNGPTPPGLPDPAALATQVAALNHATQAAPLQSLGAVAVPLFLSNIEINSLSGVDLNQTRVWDPTQQLYIASSRTDAPANALRVVLYSIDSTSGLPAVPLVEVGALDLYPDNVFIGGPMTKDSMRYVVSGTGATPLVYADFSATTNYQPGCLCATVAGWVGDGVTRIDFSAPYSIISGGVTTFSGDLSVAPQSLHLLHTGGLPPLGDSLASGDVRFAFLGDSLESQTRLSFHSVGSATADFTILVNRRTFATGSHGSGGESFTGPGGRALTGPELAALHELALLPLGLALNVEFPTLTTFYCGC